MKTIVEDDTISYDINILMILQQQLVVTYAVYTTLFIVARVNFRCNGSL